MDDELKAMLDKQAQQYISMIEREFSSACSFVITEEQQKRIAAWLKEQHAKVVHMQQQQPDKYKDNHFVQNLLSRGIPYYGVSGGAINYHFAPTGLGMVFKVTHAFTQETLDLTDYDSW